MKCFQCNNIIEGIYKNNMQMPFAEKEGDMFRILVIFPENIPLCTKCKCEILIKGFEKTLSETQRMS